MKFFLTILITLLVYNLFGTILYFKERHSRIASSQTVFYLVGIYLPVVLLIECIISFLERIRFKKALY